MGIVILDEKLRKEIDEEMALNQRIARTEEEEVKAETAMILQQEAMAEAERRRNAEEG